MDQTDLSDISESAEFESETDAEATWLRANDGSELAATSTVLPDPVFPHSEDIFRGIYTRAGVGFAAEVIAISSAIAGEGKTTVAIGLAVAIANDFPDRRVLLVETDLHRPVMAQDFDLEAGPGLVDCLVRGLPLLSVCRPSYIGNLHIVPAGEVGVVRGRPLRSSNMAVAVDEMRQNYDIVILDLPSILDNTDAILMTDLADGILCVVRAGVTPMPMVTRAIEQVEDTKFRGVVINGAQSSLPGWLRRLVGI
jgi:Mrp family chromosome partitioning ATPase